MFRHPRPTITRRVRVIVACAGIAAVLGAVTYFVVNARVTAADRNISYCKTTDHSRTLDVYRVKSGTPAPYVVYIHGGGWRRGDKVNTLTREYAPYFTARGVTFVSVNYRLTTQALYPAQNEDVACALEFLGDNATRFNLDTTRSLFFGDSAGGELAAFAALAIPYKGYDYPAPKGVIDFYGVSDFTTIVSGARVDRNARFYLGSRYNQLAGGASPITYVTQKAPRFLFVHGARDRVVPLAQTNAINDALTALGVDTERVVLSRAGHGFVGPELRPADQKAITSNIDTFVRETVQK